MRKLQVSSVPFSSHTCIKKAHVWPTAQNYMLLNFILFSEIRQFSHIDKIKEQDKTCDVT